MAKILYDNMTIPSAALLWDCTMIVSLENSVALFFVKLDITYYEQANTILGIYPR